VKEEEEEEKIFGWISFLFLHRKSRGLFFYVTR